MANEILGSNMKVCATCEYFNGDRTPSMGGFVKVNSDNGKCYVINKQGLPMKSMYSCGNWKKWGVL